MGAEGGLINTKVCASWDYGTKEPPATHSNWWSQWKRIYEMFITSTAGSALASFLRVLDEWRLIYLMQSSSPTCFLKGFFVRATSRVEGIWFLKGRGLFAQLVVPTCFWLWFPPKDFRSHFRLHITIRICNVFFTSQQSKFGFEPEICKN